MGALYVLRRRPAYRQSNVRLYIFITLAFIVCTTAMQVYLDTKLWRPRQVVLRTAASTLAAPSNYGISGGGNWVGLSDAELGSRMDGLVDLGVSRLRIDLSWYAVQSIDNVHYKWDPYDKIVALANAHGIKILFILNLTPPWARPADCTASAHCHPADPNLFATFAAAAVTHYAPLGVHAWEVWNEENRQGAWQPMPDPAAYAALLKAAYAAIKAKDPSAVVLNGGLGSISPGKPDIDPVLFLQRLYENGAGASFDALSDHPYSFPVLASYTASWNAWQRMIGEGLDGLRGVMLANGDTTKKVWITEFGAPTGGPGPAADVGAYNLTGHPTHVSEALQSAIMNDVLTQYRQLSYAGPFYWYSYKDNGTSTDTVENFFGLVRADGSKKPAYDTYKYLILGAAAPSP